VKNISLAVDVPVIMDIDAGYGNAMNTWRCVREFERAGVVGGHLEDQVVPKRCGHLDGKRLISTREMIGKIQAAAEARTDPDWTIIARTDSREKLGLDEAIRRSKEYVAAGADCIFLEAMLSVDEMKRARDAIDAPLLANMVEGGKTPILPASELEALGFAVVIFAAGVVRAVARTAEEFYASLKAHGSTAPFRGRMFDFTGLNQLIGTPEMLERGRRYAGLEPESGQASGRR
jgi:carboxyphosphoenolpyruvate mutase